MFALIVQFATTIRAVLVHAPSNRLASCLRTRGGLGSALAAMAAGAVYLYVAAVCTMLLERGGPGWLNVLVLLFIYNAFKLALTGPAILVARARQQFAQRRSPRKVHASADELGGEVVQLRWP
ncbi:hypothetical protein BH23ACT6_BH23ACT6_27230 [soil metagenome]